MSRLNFATLNEAFNLGSEQIKNTRDEIDRLKKVITDSTLSKSKKVLVTGIIKLWISSF